MSFLSSVSLFRRGLSMLALSGSLMLLALGGGAAHAGQILKADMAAYQQAVAQKKPIIMHVHASWCPVCAKQSPIIETLMQEPEFKDVVVFTIDFEADKPLVEMLDVKYQSTLIAARGQNEVERATGLTDKEKLRQFIRKAL